MEDERLMEEELLSAYARTIGPLGGARIAAKDFAAQLRDGDSSWLTDGGQGAMAVQTLLVAHWAAAPERISNVVDAQSFDEAGAMKGAKARMDDAVAVIAMAALAHLEMPDARLDTDSLLRTAFTEDASSRLVRAGVLGRVAPPDLPGAARPFGKDWLDLPEGRRRGFETLERYGWYRELMDALRGFGEAAQPADPPRPWQPDSISAVVSPHAAQPNRACPGDLLTIRRAPVKPDFGSAQPADVVVMFRSLDGSTTPTAIGEVPPGGWTPDAVSVRVPAMEGRVCIAFLRITLGRGASLAVAAGNLVDVLTQLSPAVGSWASGAFGTAGALGSAPVVGPALDAAFACGAHNTLEIGRPRIRRFAATGAAAAGTLKPRQTFGLDWVVENVDRITIRIASAGPSAGAAPAPPAPPAGVLPATGSANLGDLEGLGTMRFRCTLEAENSPCGTATRSFDIDYAATIGLVFMGGGTRSAFDLGAIEYLSLALPIRPKVFAGSGFGGVSAIMGAFDMALGEVNAARARPQNSRLATFWEAATAWTAFDVNALPIPPPGMRSIEDMIDTTAEKIFYTIGGTAADLTLDQIKDVVKEAVTDGMKEAFGDAAKDVVGTVAFVIVMILKAIEAIQKIADALVQQAYKSALVATRASRNPAALRALLAGGLPRAGLPSDVRIVVPLVDLASGALLFADQSGVLRRFTPGANPFPPAGIALTRAEVMTASTAAPGRHPPLATGGTMPAQLADGALCDPVPIAAAVREGADHLFVVSPNGGVLGSATFPAAGPNVFSAAERAIEIRNFAEARRAMHPFEGWAEAQPFPVPVEYIEASVPVHDGTVTDPGLVAIMRDYGWMRAFDTVAPGLMLAGATPRGPLSARLRAFSDRITLQRFACRRIENEMEAMRLPSVVARIRGETTVVPIRDGIAVTELRRMKREILTQLIQRAVAVREAYVAGGRRAWPPAAVPPGWEAWFETFERHPFPVGLVRAAPSFGDPEDPNNPGIASPWTSLTGFRDPASSEGIGAEPMPDRALAAGLFTNPP